MDVYIQGESSETETVGNQIEDLKEEEYEIREFYGDGAYHNNGMFNLLKEVGSEPAIKIRKNASTSHPKHKGKERRKAIREYNWFYDIENGVKRRNMKRGGMQLKE